MNTYTVETSQGKVTVQAARYVAKHDLLSGRTVTLYNESNEPVAEFIGCQAVYKSSEPVDHESISRLHANWWMECFTKHEDKKMMEEPEPKAEPDLSVWIPKEGEQCWQPNARFFMDSANGVDRCNGLFPDYHTYPGVRAGHNLLAFRSEQQAGWCIAMIRLRQIADVLNATADAGKVEDGSYRVFYQVPFTRGGNPKHFLNGGTSGVTTPVVLFRREEDVRRAVAQLEKEGLLKYITQDNGRP